MRKMEPSKQPSALEPGAAALFLTLKAGVVCHLKVFCQRAVGGLWTGLFIEVGEVGVNGLFLKKLISG